MSNVISGSGVAGIQQGMQAITRATERVAAPPAFSKTTDTLTRSLVEMQQAQVQVDAAAKVVSRQDQTLGSLIDITV